MILRINQWSDDNVGIGHRRFWKEAKPQSRLDHALHPVVSGRPENDAWFNAPILEVLGDIPENLALRAADIGLLMKIGCLHDRTGAERVIGRQENYEFFLEDRELMKRVRQAFMAADNRNLQIAFLKPLYHLRRAVVDHFYFDIRVVGLEPGQQSCDQLRSDRAHHTDPEFYLLQAFDCLRRILCRSRLRVDAFQIRQHDASEFGQMRIAPLAIEQGAAKFMFQLLDGARERRLGHVTHFGRAREIERLRERHEIANLLHFHRRKFQPHNAKRPTQVRPELTIAA